MSASRLIYVDSSALVKLAVREPESQALRRHLLRRRTLVSSALARVEVLRALLSLGEPAVRRGEEVLAGIDLVRINDRVLRSAAELTPEDVRSLDAIHLATAGLFGAELHRIVTYDKRMASAAEALGWHVDQPR
jgi:predicted nucleic acid-binding protein